MSPPSGTIRIHAVNVPRPGVRVSIETPSGTGAIALESPEAVLTAIQMLGNEGIDAFGGEALARASLSLNAAPVPGVPQ